jgi:hypothetical protein
MTEQQGQTLSTTPETRARLDVTRQTVFNWMKRGKLTTDTSAVGRGIGGQRVFFHATQVDALGMLGRSPEVHEAGGKRNRSASKKQVRDFSGSRTWGRQLTTRVSDSPTEQTIGWRARNRLEPARRISHQGERQGALRGRAAMPVRFCY